MNVPALLQLYFLLSIEGTYVFEKTCTRSEKHPSVAPVFVVV